LRLARELYSGQRIVVIDADKSIEEIGAQILKEALNYLQFIPGKSG